MREHRKIIKLHPLLYSGSKGDHSTGVGLSLWRALAPEKSEVGERVGEFLSRHRGVGEHACAGMAFADGVESGFIGGQSKRLPIPEVGRWRVELSDERSGVGCKLRSLVLVPVDAMAVVAHTRPVEDCSAPFGIACFLCALE